jgi:anti-sigma factor RsiW
MQFPNDNSNIECRGLNDYLDGEMSASDRNAFEAHIEECAGCRIEIELHREIENIPDAIVLPTGFSKVVAATAESQVSGLRKRKERKTTLAIIAGLMIAVFLVLGANMRSLVSVLAFGVEKAGSFLGLVGTFLLNLVLGLAVIVKVAATQAHFSDPAVLLVFSSGIGILFAYFYFSPRMSRLRDVKR